MLCHTWIDEHVAHRTRSGPRRDQRRDPRHRPSATRRTRTHRLVAPCRGPRARRRPVCGLPLLRRTRRPDHRVDHRGLRRARRRRRPRRQRQCPAPPECALAGDGPGGPDVGTRTSPRVRPAVRHPRARICGPDRHRRTRHPGAASPAGRRRRGAHRRRCRAHGHPAVRSDTARSPRLAGDDRDRPARRRDVPGAACLDAAVRPRVLRAVQPDPRHVHRRRRGLR